MARERESGVAGHALMWREQIRCRTRRRRQVGKAREARQAGVGHRRRARPRFPRPGRPKVSVRAATASAPAPRDTGVWIALRLLGYPPVAKQPAEESGEAAPADNGHGAHALLEYADEADDEDDDGTDVLHDDGGVGDQGPELVGLKARVELELLEEGRLVGVVVGVW